MSPRVLDVDRCPHCQGVLTKPTPRVCPHCAGSIQARYPTAGCLTSAPKLFLLAASVVGLVELARALSFV